MDVNTRADGGSWTLPEGAPPSPSFVALLNEVFLTDSSAAFFAGAAFDVSIDFDSRELFVSVVDAVVTETGLPDSRAATADPSVGCWLTAGDSSFCKEASQPASKAAHATVIASGGTARFCFL